MKFKFLFLTILLCAVMVASSCGTGSTQKNQDETAVTTTGEKISKEETTISITAKQTNVEKETQEDVGGAVLEVDKYRMRYYSIAGPFVDLVGQEEYYQWVLKQPYPNDTNVMMMVNFIKDFNISREDFDRANLEFAKRIKELLDGVPIMNPQDYANQEPDEIYNADIIYTFDNDLINEYYLGNDYPYLYDFEYKEALEAGTYETRTTDWVNIEQMEAEINAKYGENETIVAETPETTTTEVTE